MVKVSEELAAWIDAERGSQPRPVFVRDLILSAMAAREAAIPAGRLVNTQTGETLARHPAQRAVSPGRPFRPYPKAEQARGRRDR